MNKTAQINASVVKHSINPHGGELISIQGYAPYFLDAELEKHGMIMSNSSSNRAIPFKKMVEAEHFIPPDIRYNERGMQGFTELNTIDQKIVEDRLGYIRRLVVTELLDLSEQVDVHKQTLNRYISPWSMQNKLMTGTRDSWLGVLQLRDHPDADPSVQIWAKSIKHILTTSVPKRLKYGQWHLPYVTDEEINSGQFSDLQLLIMSSARCARTSYKLFTTGEIPTYEQDCELFMKLVGSNPVHATPLEHQGLSVEPIEPVHPNYWQRGQTHMMRDGSIGSGRMIGWIQNRHWWNYANGIPE